MRERKDRNRHPINPTGLRNIVSRERETERERDRERDRAVKPNI